MKTARGSSLLTALTGSIILLCGLFPSSALAIDIDTEALPNGREMEAYSVQLTTTNSMPDTWWAVETDSIFVTAHKLYPTSSPLIKQISCERHNDMTLFADGSISSTNDDPIYAVPDDLGPAKYVAAGIECSLAIKADGTVAAWGKNNNGCLDVPVGLQFAQKVMVDDQQCMALTASGEVFAWGNNHTGQCSIPESVVDALDISSGNGRNLALIDNGVSSSVITWGNVNETRQLPNRATQVTSGYQHDLALLTNGTVFAWGNNDSGQCDVPANLDNVVAIAAGNDVSIALKNDGTIVTWGIEMETSGLTDITAIFTGWNVSYEEDNFRALRDTHGGLPPGLTLSEEGLLSGFPEQAGTYSITLDFGDGLPRYSLPIRIEANGNLRPEITGFSPEETIADIQEMESQFFSVIAADPEGSNVVYRWTVNGIDAGETSSSYIYTPAWGEIGIRNVCCYVSDGLWNNVVYQKWDAYVENRSITITDPLPPAVELMPYYTQLQAENGVAPYSWQMLPEAQTWGDVYLEEWIEAPNDLHNVASIDTGYGHYVALMKDGTVRGWGRNDREQAAVPSGLTNVVSISADCWNSMAVHADGTVTRWGVESYYNWTAPDLSGLSNVVEAASGGVIGAVVSDAYFLLNDGTVERRFGTRKEMLTGWTDMVAISAGAKHVLGLRSDGIVLASGDNDRGQCDIPGGLNQVIAISAGPYYSMALKSDGTVEAWGKYNETTSGHYFPLGPIFVPEGLNDVMDIAAGFSFCLALKTDGSVEAWGNMQPIFTQNFIEIPNDLPKLKTIAAGYSCIGLIDNSVKLPEGLELSADGIVSGIPQTATTNQILITVTDALGEHITLERNLPIQTHPNARPQILWTTPQDQETALAQGDSQEFIVAAFDPESAALTYNWTLDATDTGSISNSNTLDTAALDLGRHTLRCYISDDFWQDEVFAEWSILIIAALPPVITTDLLPTGKSYRPYDAQLTAAQGLPPYRFFFNLEASEIGKPYQSLAAELDEMHDIVAIASRTWHSLALRADGTIIQWGGRESIISTPPTKNAQAIACGHEFSLALDEDATVVAWGNNNYGQCDVPEDLNQVTAISCGYFHSLALNVDGSVVAWGRYPDVPIGLPTVTAIAAGRLHNLALLQDGSIKAWGESNDSGQLDVPAELSNTVAIAAGNEHSLALNSDGTVAAWGDNTYGQCDVPLGLSNVAEIACGTDHSLALLVDGSVVAWGRNTEGQCDIIPELTPTAMVAGGEKHTLVLSQNRDLMIPEIGMDINGHIEGTPRRPGTYWIDFLVRDASGQSNYKKLPLAVEQSYQPRIIDSTPEQGVAEMGEALDMLFSVTAEDLDGDPLTYEWTWNGTTMPSTSSNFTHTSSWGDAGTYQLVCNVSDGYFLPVSATWEVTVLNDNDKDGVVNADEIFAGTNPNAPDSFFGVQRVLTGTTDEAFLISFSSVPGRSYRVLYTEDLLGTWQNASDIIVATEDLTTWTAPSMDQHPNRFYRVVVLAAD